MFGIWGFFQCNVYNFICLILMFKMGYKILYKLSIDCDNIIYSNKGLKQIFRIKRIFCIFFFDIDVFVNILDKVIYCKIGKNCVINKWYMLF